MSGEPIRLAVLGATGRMGRRVIDLAGADGRFAITALLTAHDDPRLGELIRVNHGQLTAGADTSASFDVMIDFSAPAAVTHWAPRCAESKAAFVTGTTGFSPAEIDVVRRAAAAVPVVMSANFSIGITRMLAWAARMASELGDGFDVEIVETHHNRKADAPSGTALALLEALVQATGRSRERDAVFGRSGRPGARPRRQIGVHAVRMGDVVGEHEIHFAGPGETITLRHRALSRDTFVRGALQAAAWVVGRPPGLYSMRDVCG